MAFFFALIAQEIVEAVLPGGPFHSWRRWIVPLVAAAGGFAGAGLVYVTYVGLSYEPLSNRRGRWRVPLISSPGITCSKRSFDEAAPWRSC